MTAVCDPQDVLPAKPLAGPTPAILDASIAMSVSPFPLSRVVLTGFMGAGKSTVGRLLAGRLGWDFVDVDDAIVSKAGMPVAEIFAKYGEFVFRRMETSAIAHALGGRNTVVALGGGAVEVLANRLLLEQTPRTAVVFLDGALSVLLDRCQNQTDAAERPNLRVAEERFRYRTPLYRRVAQVRVDTAEHTPEQSVTLLQQRLSLRNDRP